MSIFVQNNVRVLRRIDSQTVSISAYTARTLKDSAPAKAAKDLHRSSCSFEENLRNSLEGPWGYSSIASFSVVTV